MALQHLRSGTANKRPLPTAMSDGQLAVNTNLASPGLFFKDSNGDLVKAGPVHVGTTAPNASPASTAATALVANTIYQILTIGTSDFTAVGASANTVGVVFTATGTTTGTGTVSGQQGNEKGEQWLDTTNSLYVMKVYDGTGWRVTDSISLANGTAAAPSLHFGSDTNTGLFRSAADSLAITTAGTQRVTVDSSGNVGIGTTSPSSYYANHLVVSGSAEGGITIDGPTTGQSYLAFADGTSGNARYRGFIAYDHATDSLKFASGAGERLRIDNSGRVLVGTFSARTVYGGGIQVESLSNANLNLVRNATGATQAAAINISRSRGSSVGSNTAVQSGDDLGFINFTGADGTDIATEAAQIRCQVDGTPGSNDMPGRLMFFTTADGASSPTERMRIDSSGRVGIGTSSLGSFSSGANTLVVGTVSGNAGITINNGAADQIGSIFFAEGTGATGPGRIRYEHANNAMAFSTLNTERLRIDSSGKVGIGESSPDQLLHLKSTGFPTLRVEDADNSTYFDIANSDGDIILKADEGNSFANSAIRFMVDSSEKTRIDSSGNVGIGTTSPSSFGKFAIRSHAGTIDAVPNVSAHIADGSNSALYIGHSSGLVQLVANSALSFGYTNGTTNSERMRIDSAGKIGIGTSSPGTTLEVDGGNAGFTGTATIRLRSDSNGANGSVCDLTSVGTGANDSALSFSTRASGSLNEKARITSAGKIGVGTTNPANQFEVVSSVATKANFTHASSNKTSLYLESDDTSARIGSTYFGSGGSFKPLAFLTAGAERMRIDSSGRLLLGTTTEGEATADNLTIADSGHCGITLRSGTSSVGTIFFSDATSGAAEYRGVIQYDHNGDYLKWVTAGAERMRIDSSGQIFMNTNSQLGSGYVQHLKMNSGTGGIIIQNYGGSNTAMAFRNSAGNATVGSITTGGTTTAYNTSSDYRLKENVIDIADGITRVKQLSPKRFNFIADDTTIVDGFIAHEAQAVVPEAVTGTKDEVDDDGDAVMQGIDQAKLVPLLTAALQEAIAKIETLEQRLSDAGIA